MPCRFSQVAIWAMFRSCVRPERISSPMKTPASRSALFRHAPPYARTGGRQASGLIARDDEYQTIDLCASRRDGRSSCTGREASPDARGRRLAAEILDALVPHVVPAVTTQEIDDCLR
jgi:hypothetical protein